ncbi:MAG: FHA domain-containing protein [Deltaproteobacteria bacterium]|nr:FHA domain-containing protein [Deltaproteobacteria bacterium]
MIVCPRCNKENQDHYKFCLGCGSELPRDAVQAPRDFAERTPPAGTPRSQLSDPSQVGKERSGTAVPDVSAKKQIELASTQAGRSAEEAEIKESKHEVQTSEVEKTCPKCGSLVPADFKFCGTCGHSMDQSPAASRVSAEKPSAPVSYSEPVRSPAAQSMPAAARVAGSTAQIGATRGKLILINPDGSEGLSFPLGPGKTTVGRDAGGPFAGDMYLSPVHATFAFRDAILYVSDENSLNGVFIKIDRNSPTPLVHGAIFRIGQEILLYEEIGPVQEVDGVEIMGSPNPGFIGRLSTMIGRDAIGEAFTIPPDGMHLGRERGDVTFPEDGYVSGLHCRIYKKDDTVFLTDVGSSNGTFLRVIGEQQLRNGELVLIGQQLFNVRY